MAAASYSVKKFGQGQTVTDLKKYYLLECTVSISDTITVAELTAVTAATIYNLSTAAIITCTVGTNIITVTGAATSVKVVVIVLGT